MATVRELADAYFTAEDRVASAAALVVRIQSQRASLAVQLTAAQAEEVQARDALLQAKRELKAAL